MSLLGVLPRTSSASSGPPIPHVDLPPSSSATGELDSALSRMFWRGDLRRTCAISGLDTLKQRCVEGTERGGDAEACTACVALAELHAPPCSQATPTLLPSKCEAIGAANPGSGAPGWWFDAWKRIEHPELLPEPFTTDRRYCKSPAVLALEWCTDTPGSANHNGNEGNLVARSTANFREGSSHDCDPSNSFDHGPYSWGVHDKRGARFLEETPPATPFMIGAPPWIYPMAVAYDFSVTTSPGEDPCDLIDEATTSRDSVIAANIAPGPLAEYFSVVGRGAEIPRCGISQREFTVSTSCNEAFVLLGQNLPSDMDVGVFHYDTGAALVEASDTDGYAQCWLREPRRYHPTCPAGFTCTAAGECVAGSRPAPAIISVDPPTPQP